MQIEFRKEDYKERNYRLLVIDGNVVEKSHALVFQKYIINTLDGKLISDKGVFEIVVKNKELIDRFLMLKPKDIPENIIELRFNDLINWFDGDNFVQVECNSDNEGTVIFGCFPNFTRWKFPFTFTSYHSKFKDLEISNKDASIEKLDYDYPGILIKFKLPDKELIFLDQILPYIEIVNLYHQENIRTLVEKHTTNIVAASFNFPDEVKVSCEQYLLYFAQFLHDLGINATSNLNEEAGKVLFSVTPTDDNEALDKIREALAVYLNLPSSPIVYDESFAAMRLQQQIENLEHSQKMAVREIQLAEKVIMIQSETIQEKNVIISQKDSVIEQQNKVIEKISSKSIMMDSLENKEELEEIFEGLKIGKSKFLMEQLGVHLNPATALKTGVKKILGKEDENKSILGLDNET